MAWQGTVGAGQCGERYIAAGAGSGRCGWRYGPQSCQSPKAYSCQPRLCCKYPLTTQGAMHADALAGHPVWLQPPTKPPLAPAPKLPPCGSARCAAARTSGPSHCPPPPPPLRAQHLPHQNQQQQRRHWRARGSDGDHRRTPCAPVPAPPAQRLSASQPLGPHPAPSQLLP